MATWHQQQADKRTFRPLYHATDWTVVIDPPNETRMLMCFSSKALADVYMRNLKENNPRVYPHAYVLPPGGK